MINDVVGSKSWAVRSTWWSAKQPYAAHSPAAELIGLRPRIVRWRSRTAPDVAEHVAEHVAEARRRQWSPGEFLPGCTV